MLEGLQAYWRKELSPPKCVCDATDDYRQDMDLVAHWLAERCDLDSDRENPAETPNEAVLKELAADFNAWAKNDLSRPFPSVTLSQKLQDDYGLTRRHGKKGSIFQGIRSHIIENSSTVNQINGDEVSDCL